MANRSIRRNLLILVVALLLSGAALGEEPEEPMNPPYPALLQMLSDEYVLSFCRFMPTSATRIGWHDPWDYRFDGRMEDLSRQKILSQIEDYKRLERRFKLLNSTYWPPIAFRDRDMMVAYAEASIFDLETVRWWENNPDRYSSLLGESALLLIDRDFAPAAKRLAYLVARERRMPQVLEEAKANLKNPPRPYTEVALQRLPGLIEFFRNDVPRAFTAVNDAKLQAEFHQANDGVVSALERYQAWLQHEVLPHSKGNFRLGADNLHQMLLDEEMIDVPLDRLLQIGREDLDRNRRELDRIAALIDAKKKTRQVLAESAKQPPSADQLFDTLRKRIAESRTFLEEKKLATVLPGDAPTLDPAPAYMPAPATAWLDAPGGFEDKAKRVFLRLPLSQKGEPQQQSNKYLVNDTYAIEGIALREVYPGHFEQYLWNQRQPFKIRKLINSDSDTHFAGDNVEGWAQYAEQMMLDEGFGRAPGVPEEKDTQFLRLRLEQLQHALLCDARYVTALEMHAGKMNLKQATKFFVRESYLTPSAARQEALRTAVDPAVLAAALGKLEILKLRDDYRQKMGADFSLRDFHDRFLEQGVAPVVAIRRAMLGDSTPAL